MAGRSWFGAAVVSTAWAIVAVLCLYLPVGVTSTIICIASGYAAYMMTTIVDPLTIKLFSNAKSAVMSNVRASKNKRGNNAETDVRRKDRPKNLKDAHVRAGSTRGTVAVSEVSKISLSGEAMPQAGFWASISEEDMTSTAESAQKAQEVQNHKDQREVEETATQEESDSEATHLEDRSLSAEVSSPELSCATPVPLPVPGSTTKGHKHSAHLDDPESLKKTINSILEQRLQANHSTSNTVDTTKSTTSAAVDSQQKSVVVSKSVPAAAAFLSAAAPEFQPSNLGLSAAAPEFEPAKGSSVTLSASASQFEPATKHIKLSAEQLTRTAISRALEKEMDRLKIDAGEVDVRWRQCLAAEETSQDEMHYLQSSAQLLKLNYLLASLKHHRVTEQDGPTAAAPMLRPPKRWPPPPHQEFIERYHQQHHAPQRPPGQFMSRDQHRPIVVPPPPRPVCSSHHRDDGDHWNQRADVDRGYQHWKNRGDSSDWRWEEEEDDARDREHQQWNRRRYREDGDHEWGQQRWQDDRTWDDDHAERDEEDWRPRLREEGQYHRERDQSDTTGHRPWDRWVDSTRDDDDWEVQPEQWKPRREDKINDVAEMPRHQRWTPTNGSAEGDADWQQVNNKRWVPVQQNHESAESEHPSEPSGKPRWVQKMTTSSPENNNN